MSIFKVINWVALQFQLRKTRAHKISNWLTATIPQMAGCTLQLNHIYARHSFKGENSGLVGNFKEQLCTNKEMTYHKTALTCTWSCTWAPVQLQRENITKLPKSVKRTSYTWTYWYLLYSFECVIIFS